MYRGSSIELSADGPVKPPVCRVFPGWTYLGTCKTWSTDVFAETGRCEYCDTSVKIEGRIVAAAADEGDDMGEKTQVIVIGGGASGLQAAIAAAD